TQAAVIDRERASAQHERGKTQQKRIEDVQRLADVKATIAPLSPLLSDDNYNNADVGGEGKLFADQGTDTDLAKLRQTALVTKQNEYSNRAGGYVAVITVLAVALFLAGLSLTVGGAFRLLLLVPSMLIGLWC